LLASTRFKAGTVLTVTPDAQSILIGGQAQLDLPTSPNAFDTTWNGMFDAFVARMDGELSQVIGATYVGGSRGENAIGLAVDPGGDIVFCGATSSDNYPTTPGAYDTVKNGAIDWTTSMVSYLSADLSQLRYSTFLGPAQPI
jgi:hypothetical protein